MNKKHRFFDVHIYKFLFPIVLIIFIMLFITAIGNFDPNLPNARTPLIICAVLLLLCIALIPFYFQYAIIDDEGVAVRNLFHVIQRKSWSEIQGIEVAQFQEGDNDGVGYIRYFVFYDGSSNRPGYDWKIRKNTLIKFTYSKNREDILKQYWIKNIKLITDSEKSAALSASKQSNYEKSHKYKFVDDSAFAFLLVAIFGICIFICALINRYNKYQSLNSLFQKPLIYVFIAFWVVILFFVAAFLIDFEYVTIDEKGIIVRGIFHIIQQKSWSEIYSIDIMKFTGRGHNGVRSFVYFVFQDGSSNQPPKDWKIKKNTLIQIPYSDKNNAILKDYRGKIAYKGEK